MAIVKIDHISILADEPLPVIELYRAHLGFELVQTRELDELGMTIHDLTARAGEHLEIIRPHKPHPQIGQGLKHIAFLSDDIQADHRDLQARGAPLVHQTVQRIGQTDFFFLKSPSGEYVEIVQHRTGPERTHAGRPGEVCREELRPHDPAVDPTPSSRP